MDRRGVNSSGVVNVSRLASRLWRSARRESNFSSIGGEVTFLSQTHRQRDTPPFILIISDNDIISCLVMIKPPLEGAAVAFNERLYQWPD